MMHLAKHFAKEQNYYSRFKSILLVVYIAVIGNKMYV